MLSGNSFIEVVDIEYLIGFNEDAMENPVHLTPLFYAGLLLLLGYFAGALASYFKLPRITGYLIVGVITGPSVLKVFPEIIIKEKLSFILDLALGFIAFSIGGSMNWQGIKKLGKTILTITAFEAFFAFLIAAAAIFFLFPFLVSLTTSNPVEAAKLARGEYFSIGIIIGSMSAATAPAAVLALIHQFRSSGKLTNILLGVVALDDAVAITLFAFALPIAQVILTSTSTDFTDVIKGVYFEISLSVFLGLISGFIFKFLVKVARSRQEILAVITGSIFILYGITSYFEASPLLSNMIFGFVVTNSPGRTSSIFDAVEDLEESIFAMFFTLAGTHMDLSLIVSAGALGTLLVISRFIGKYFGTILGGTVSGLDRPTGKFLAMGLLPQAGVTVGLLMEAGHTIHGYAATLMINAVLASVVINELIAPFFVKYALFKSGEAKKK